MIVSLVCLFFGLQQEDETKAKRALVTLCELLKKKVWLGDRHERVAIAICEACFHASPRYIFLLFLLTLDYVDVIWLEELRTSLLT